MITTFFVALLVHAPVVSENAYLITEGLMGIILQWGCFPVILAALLLQTVFFHYGDLLVPAVNTTTMIRPLLCYHLFYPRITTGSRRKVAVFTGGVASLLSSITVTDLSSTDQRSWGNIKLLIGTHIPLMIVERFITLFAILLPCKEQP